MYLTAGWRGSDLSLSRLQCLQAIDIRREGRGDDHRLYADGHHATRRGQHRCTRLSIVLLKRDRARERGL
jgi:hypothetical protein